MCGNLVKGIVTQPVLVFRLERLDTNSEFFKEAIQHPRIRDINARLAHVERQRGKGYAGQTGFRQKHSDLLDQ